MVKLKLIIILTITLLALTYVVPNGFFVNAASSNDDWTMFHYNPAHTGLTTANAPLTNQTLWNYTTGVGAQFAAIEGSPAIADGIVYVGSNDGKLYALD